MVVLRGPTTPQSHRQQFLSGFEQMCNMPRQIVLDSDGLKMKFSGLKHFETLETEFDVPYAEMSSVSTEIFDFPTGTYRFGGVRIPFTDIREGHFEWQGHWYFVSFEDSEKVVTIYLKNFVHKGRHYSVVAFQVDNPEDFVEKLLELAPHIKRVQP